jgi:toxin ParE1/3/4
VSRHYTVVFTPEAQADLLELYDYIAEHSSADRALEYIDRLGKLTSGLASFPERGTVRDDIRPGLRVIGFEHRVSIAFRVKSEAVTILRILYAGRDVGGNRR